MPLVEFHCLACKREYESHLTASEWPYPNEILCRCGMMATRYFSAPPTMSPDPHWSGYYDTQLGRYIDSRDEKRRLLKEKGLVEVSAEEYRKGFESCGEKEDVIPENDPKFRAAMEKAYADMQAGRLEPVTPRTVQADVVS